MATLSFRSPGNAQYVATIGSEGNKLIGSRHPFVIEEDDNDDLFTPIRLRTGYVNFIDTTGEIWKTLIPSYAWSVPVQCNGELMFLKPETYGNPFNYAPKEFSLPICCPLCVLKSLSLPVDPTEVGLSPLASFSDLMTAMVNLLNAKLPTGISVSLSVVDPPGTLNMGFTNLQIQYSNLLDEDNEGNVSMKYSCYELLEHICTYLGMTARSYGSTIVIQGQYVVITPSPTITVTPPFKLADTSSTDEIVQGVNKVKMDININKEQTILEFPSSQIRDYALDGVAAQTLTIQNTPYGTGSGMLYYVSGITSPKTFGSVEIDWGGDASVTVGEWDDNGVASDNYSKMKATISMPDNDGLNNGVIHSYFSIENDVQHFFVGGFLLLKGRIYKNHINNDQYTQKTLTGMIGMSLHIGSYWYVDGEWEYGSVYADHINYFAVKNGVIGRGNPDYGPFGELIDIYDFYQDIKIQIPTFVYGDFGVIGVKLIGGISAGRISQPTQLIAWGFYEMEDFSIEYKRDELHTKESYTKNAGGDAGNYFDNNISLSGIFATDGPRIGYGRALLVLGSTYYQGNPTDIMSTPEGNTVSRIAAFGKSTHRLLTLNLLEDDDVAAAIPTSIISYNSELYLPISISRDYGEGKATVKLLALPSST